MTLIQRSIVHLRWLSTVADFCGEMLRVLRLKPVSTRGGPEVVRVRVRLGDGTGGGLPVRVRGFECDHGLQYWSTGDLKRMAVLQTHPHYWTKLSWGVPKRSLSQWPHGRNVPSHLCWGFWNPWWREGHMFLPSRACILLRAEVLCIPYTSNTLNIHIWDLGWITLPYLPFTLQHATLHYFVLHYVA